MTPVPHSARSALQEAVRKSDPESLNGIVARHLLSCVERFGEEAYEKAVNAADTLLTEFLHTRDITRFNDALRRDLDPAANGAVVMTSGVSALGKEVINAAMTALREFDEFTEDNDPYHEHDFGSFVAAGRKFMWKIDYYDLALEFHSPNPADPKVTRRVLTLMLPEEY